MYYKRRTIVKVKQENKADNSPFNDEGKLNKGFRYIGNGKIKDSQGNEYLINDYR